MTVRSLLIATAVTLMMPAGALAADPFEPNEDPEHAVPLVSGQTVSADIGTANDKDVYKFTTTKPYEQVAWTMDPVKISGGVRWNWDMIPKPNVFDEMSNTLYLPGPTPEARRYQWQLSKPGTYVLTVTDNGWYGPALSPYTFTIDQTQPPNEPNATLDQATPITSGQVISGAIDTHRDVDLYQFVAPNDGMTAHMKLTSGTLKTSESPESWSARILGSDGETIKPSGAAGDGDIGPNMNTPGAYSEADVPLGAAGTYYFSVSGYLALLDYQAVVTYGGGTPPVSGTSQSRSPRAPGVSGRCLSARRGVRSKTKLVSQLRRKLRVRPTPKRRRAYNRARAQLRVYKHRRSVYC